jgi:hypothetical protein
MQRQLHLLALLYQILASLKKKHVLRHAQHQKGQQTDTHVEVETFFGKKTTNS